MRSNVRKKAIITVRIVNTDAQKIKRISDERGITIADLVREAIRRYLNETENEAKGVGNSGDSGV